MTPLYTAEALATGDGRNGHARTTDGKVDVNLSAPKELGGNGEGTNPEQLFAAGYAACFHGALRLVGKNDGVNVDDSAVGAKVSLGKNDAGGFQLAVVIEVTLPNLSRDEAQALADKAHQVCPYSNATRGNIDVAVTVAED
ncbi:organic hydroperoxide resistance protein [Nocardia sp. NPDC127579]|uniref:organic hydroperoxide resistance protein n=1 Tax=Nocardia sp. NPDC127579 TaxID=3345402 RepID=UPI00363581DC